MLARQELYHLNHSAKPTRILEVNFWAPIENDWAISLCSLEVVLGDMEHSHWAGDLCDLC
jgi:hypothetical protein